MPLPDIIPPSQFSGLIGTPEAPPGVSVGLGHGGSMPVRPDRLPPRKGQGPAGLLRAQPATMSLHVAGKGGGAITGDFVLTAAEVVPVQRAPVENDVEVTAIHGHMPG